MSMQVPIERYREEIMSLAEHYGVYDIRMFGSVARGEAQPGSDLDLVVKIAEKRNFLHLVGFWQALEELLPWKVDIVVEGGISPYLESTILAQAKSL